MATQLTSLLTQLRNPSLDYTQASTLLSKAKILLLQSRALTPSPQTPSALLSQAREILELGALHSIRAAPTRGDTSIPAFIRYVQQLSPFYELTSNKDGGDEGQKNKITGLYLLLLLTQGRYAEFHIELETLQGASGGSAADQTEKDRYLGYPIKLERWLMEGSYDRVWKALKAGEVPSEEYGVFSSILTDQIREEIATSSEKAYPSLPISSTKSLLFLDSEGDVVKFAQHRGWIVRDGRIYFPVMDDLPEDGMPLETSKLVIEHALQYAEQLETIV